jgi:2-oxoglutarate ferredoxin oxidoreductase subunit delta
LSEAKVDKERCKGCLLCTAMCPKGLLKQGNEYNSFGFYAIITTGQEECTGCGMCSLICPDGAIEVFVK